MSDSTGYDYLDEPTTPRKFFYDVFDDRCDDAFTRAEIVAYAASMLDDLELVQCLGLLASGSETLTMSPMDDVQRLAAIEVIARG